VELKVFEMMELKGQEDEHALIPIKTQMLFVTEQELTQIIMKMK